MYIKLDQPNSKKGILGAALVEDIWFSPFGRKGTLKINIHKM
jgi:hypothetical protein